MICELTLTDLRTIRGTCLWYGNGIVHPADYLVAENVLDWLWQRINGCKGTLVVGKDGDRLIIETAAASNIYPYPLLFTGTAKEIVMQLRPYMKMMEGG